MWPSTVKRFLHKSFGESLSVRKIGGVVHDEGCFRVTFQNQLVIVKKTRESREWFLYKENSHTLRQPGVNHPVLYDAYTNNEEYWLVLEYIPLLLPENRWEADSSILSMLFYLHYSTWKNGRTLTNPYIPNWLTKCQKNSYLLF